MSGVGKTTFALVLADVVSDRFEDGVCVVDLAPVSDARLVTAAIGRALGLREAGRERLSATVLRYLRDRHVLLLLDNFEHVLLAATEVASLPGWLPSGERPGDQSGAVEGARRAGSGAGAAGCHV